MRRIAYVTDLHFDEQFPKDQGVNAWRNWERVLADITQRKITEIVVGGDIGEASALPDFIESLAGFSWKVTLGNHDSYEAIKQLLPATTGDEESLYGKEEDEFFRCLYLDTSPDHLSETQLNWLREALNTEKKVVIFLHHPVLAINTAVDKHYPLQNREMVKDLLLQSKKPVTLFCGHYHMAHDQTMGNIRQIITPACSLQIIDAPNEIRIDASEFGYRIITFQKDGLETILKRYKK